MVAKTIDLPNLRKIFIPDPNYTIIDIDLERADAQVVAWDAGDEVLKQMFREGVDIHVENARSIYNISISGWAALTDSMQYEKRQHAKEGVHAVNYLTTPRTLAATLGITIHEASVFIKRWFSEHPAIPNWHIRIRAELKGTHSVSNKFGYRIYYFDRMNNVLTKAVGWIPQSTVGLCTNFGMINLEDNIPEVQILLQNHDSTVFQVPTSLCPGIFPALINETLITVPYDDPLVIPVGISASEISWGDIKAVKEENGIWYKEISNDNWVLYEKEVA